ncbi:MAG TPA: diguanylate cyclase, partial [Nitrospiria bacterium]|nr:diguanylate cyclase [Nitrospiria bacterium]
RHVDISVRIRGTRFAVLLPDTGSGFGETLHRLNSSLSALEIYNAGRQRLPVKLMTGFGIYPDHAVTVEELIQKASRVWPYDEGKK